MLTIDALNAYGADTRTGLERCVGNEGLYFRLIGMTLADTKFEDLKTALDAGDLDAGFAAAHALKGVCGNLALTPLFDAVCEIVEPLRAREADHDYAALYQTIIEKRDALKAIAE